MLSGQRIRFEAVDTENLIPFRRCEVCVNVEIDAHQVYFQLAPIQFGQARWIVVNGHDPRRIGSHGIAERQRLGVNGQVLRQLGLGTTR